MPDEMTPKERRKAIAENRPYDRIPHAFAIGDAGVHLTGIKVSEYHLDVKKQLETMLANYRTYGLDGVGAQISMPELLGAQIAYPDHSTPYTEVPFDLQHPDAPERLTMDDPKTHPKLQKFWRLLDGLLDAVGHEAPVSVSFYAPFSAVGRAGSVTPLMCGLIKNPEHIHKVLRKVLDAQLAIVHSLKGYDIGFSVADPVSSGNLISPAQYQKFSKPYVTELFAAMRQVTGKKPGYHICGNTGKILKDIAETGAGSFRFDNIMDLELCKREIGHAVVLGGNIKPVDTMFLGTPQDVDEDLRSCLEKAWDSPKGYTPGFGCGLPIDTPVENLQALFAALRKYGRYPLTPANFEIRGGIAKKGV